MKKTAQCFVSLIVLVAGLRVLMITFFQFAGVSLGIFFRHIFHLIKSEN